MRLPSPKPEPVIVWRGHSCSRNASSTAARAGNPCHRLFVFLALLTVLVPCAAAQKSAAHAPAFQHFNSPSAKLASGQIARLTRFRHSSPYTSLPFPFFGDSFSLDDIYSTGYPVASQPPEFLLQAARAMSSSGNFLGQPGMARPAIGNQPSAEPLM